MNALQKIVSVVTNRKGVPELAQALEGVRVERANAEVAWDASPSDKRWSIVEDARRREAQTELMLRSAETREREERERALAEERAKKLARLAELSTFVKGGYEERLKPLASSAAARATELAKIKLQMTAVEMVVCSAAAEYETIARELGLDAIREIDDFSDWDMFEARMGHFGAPKVVRNAAHVLTYRAVAAAIRAERIERETINDARELLFVEVPVRAGT